MIIKAKLCKDSITENVVSVVITKDDGKEWAVPFEPLNTDYQAYLKWIEEGNTPLPAVSAEPEGTE